jgi:hypothetical protein
MIDDMVSDVRGFDNEKGEKKRKAIVDDILLAKSFARRTRKSIERVE